MIRHFLLIVTVSFFVSIQANSQTIKILFDATKAETAGNADWVISNSDSPQQIPSPAQSGITSTTPETYWKGGISAWGVDCVKQGYYVETLPASGKITYGLSSNLQDLSNYQVFVVCEPNTQFTAIEKAAIINFVNNGGGLFMVSDHNISDRNNDGWDSPHIWNDLLTSNTVEANPFGISFDYVNISCASFNLASSPNDSILNGKMGKVAEAEWFNGTTMTLTPTKNANVKGKIFTTGSSVTGTSNVMFAISRYGKGKVAAIGDSSPCDDGTGNTSDGLFNGYTKDAAGNHRPLLMNATIWLATSNTTTEISSIKNSKVEYTIFPNPIENGQLNIKLNNSERVKLQFQVFDLTGKAITSSITASFDAGNQSQQINLNGIQNGVYFCKISRLNGTIAKRFVITK